MNNNTTNYNCKTGTVSDFTRVGVRVGVRVRVRV
jgi:hypothetical protein